MVTRKHVATDLLLDYAERRVEPAESAEVTAHLDSGCGRCVEQLQVLRRLTAGLNAYSAPAPSEAFRQRLLAVFEQFEPRPTGWQRLVATLTFDSRRQPAMVGVREPASCGSFRLFFEADDTGVDLLCEPESGRWQITGQALSAEASAAAEQWQVSATGAAGPVPSRVDAAGIFHFEDLHPGSYDLVLREAGREIALPPIELRPL